MIFTSPDIPNIKMIKVDTDYINYSDILNEFVKDLDTIHHRIHRPYSTYDILINEFYLFFRDNDVLGYTLLSPDNEKDKYIIRNFLINKEFRNQGYGHLCFQLILDYLKYSLNIKKVTLMVSTVNKKAKNLYFSFGFNPIDIEMSEKLYLKL